jgi:hypothetical protein
VPTINGQRGAYPQPGRFGRNESGLYTIRVWEGTLREIYQVCAALESVHALWEITESFTGAKHRIEAHIPLSGPPDSGTTETPEEEWELFAQDIEVDLLNADVFPVNGLQPTDRQEIQYYIDHPPALGKDPIFKGTFPGTQLDLYHLMRSGYQSQEVSRHTLRHTQTASKNFNYATALINVGRIISTNSVIALESVPSDVTANLPNNVTPFADVVYGWLKKKPTLRSHPLKRSQLEQEWVYGLYPPLIYDNLI